nr:MAG TPA: Head Tail Connector Protein [Caudoviricetes sp.]
MAGEVSDSLLNSVKLWCNITWSDEAADAKVSDLIASGEAYIDGKLGAAGDYDAPGEPLTLLKEYVRYGLSDALDVFETNYLNRLLAMQHERQVAQYAADAV